MNDCGRYVLCQHDRQLVYCDIYQWVSIVIWILLEIQPHHKVNIHGVPLVAIEQR